MADEYWEWIRSRCAEANGKVFVADQDGSVVGFVSVLAAQPFEEPDDPPGHYALLTDLVVLSSYRGAGIGRELMERAEAFARSAGATELRVGVLAANSVARTLYLNSGFVPHLEVFTKRWVKPAV